MNLDVVQGNTLHGGPDALGVPAHDFSTNANAAGPCPLALHAVQAADARHYPDPGYALLGAQLAAWHGVAPARIVLGASASELIQRISTAIALQAVAAGEPAPGVWLPAHAYADYARAAQAVGLTRCDRPAHAALLWACEPSSPLGQAQPQLAECVAALRAGQTLVLDEAYAPLRLQGAPSLDAAALERVWRLFSPNKALGLTGVRAAYLIAPHDAAPALLARVRALVPSWPVGAHGVALLQVWATAAAHQWIAASRDTLRAWKARQIALLTTAGWQIQASDANFFIAARACGCSADGQFDMKTLLTALRRHGIKLRDAASFGLPGSVRIAVAPPASQDALVRALRAIADEALA